MERHYLERKRARPPPGRASQATCQRRPALARRMRRTWPALDLARTAPLTMGRSHAGTLSVMRPFTLHKGITSAVNVGKLSATRTNVFSTRKYTQKKSLVSAVNVGNYLATAPTFCYMRKPTANQHLLSPVTTGNVLALTPAPEYSRPLTWD